MLSDVTLRGAVWLLTQFLLQVAGQTWYEYEGHCYAILSDKNNFNSCKVSCQKYGSYITELESEPELHWVQTLISGTSEQYWAGLDYNSSTKKFTWLNNKKEPTSAMWLPTEPNDTGFCVRLATEAQTGADPAGSTFLLGDHPCSNNYKVICEKNADMLEAVNYSYRVVSPKNRCPMTPYTTRSRLDCARSCSKNPSCTGFQYNTGTQLCTLYRFSTSCPTPLSSPVSMCPGIYIEICKYN